MADDPPRVPEAQAEDFFSKILSVIGETTEEQVSILLKKKKQTIAVAESLTGGLISHRLTAIPGSSDYFIGGVVCYHNRIKIMELGVAARIIKEFGVVSSNVAVAMAENIRKRYKTNIGLAATGVAGPKTGTPPTPIGLTYVALSTEEGVEWKQVQLSGNREEIRQKASQAALGLLWLHLGGEEVVHMLQEEKGPSMPRRKRREKPHIDPYQRLGGVTGTGSVEKI